MAYVGNQPSGNFVQVTSQTITGNGGSTYTLDRPAGNSAEIEVFVNHVRQDPASYTVSGTSLTLGGNIASTDSCYVVFQSAGVGTVSHPATNNLQAADGTFTGAFTSPGIDDNATSTVMTLDSSGNLLVAKTAVGLSTTGFQAIATGNQNAFISDGDRALILNRKTSDGSVQEFRKDGTTAGSIGVSGGDLTIYGDVGIRFSGDDVRPLNSSGAQADIAVDLGHHDVRWKDIYLSGGAYLSGTSSAHHLDTYETGTWVPTPFATYSSPTITSVSGQSGSYVRVGDQVSAWFSVTFNSNAAGNIGISGLPFSVSGASSVCGGARKVLQLVTGFRRRVARRTSPCCDDTTMETYITARTS